MCTLIVAWRVFDGVPVAVAANRDESLDRPSRPPTVWDGDRRFVAPRDELAGGTWIGYNEAGVLAAISNRWLEESLPADRSRGSLLTDVLGCERADEAAGLIEDELAAVNYDGFNLVIADADAALLVEWDGRLGIVEFEPGVHVVTNAGYDDTFRFDVRPGAARRQSDAARRIREVLRPELDETVDRWLGRAAAVLGDHELGVCVHGDGFGTRSSSTIAIEGDGSATYWFADGPPCETEFERVVADRSEGQS